MHANCDGGVVFPFPVKIILYTAYGSVPDWKRQLFPSIYCIDAPDVSARRQHLT